MRTRISIDENKWKEISRRLGGAELNDTIDILFSKLLARLIDREVEMGVVFSQAINDTIEEIT
jgi:hypothetical protein